MGPQGLVEQALAQGRRFFLLGVLEEMPDLGSRLTGTHIAQPGRIGAGVGRGDDLDLVTVMQLGAKGHQFAVDAPGHAAVAHVGVHRIGKIHHRCAPWQGKDLALGGEGVDLAGKEIDLDVLQEFAGIARGGLELEQGLQPAMGLVLELGEGLFVFLVQPVRSDSRLCHALHFARADLKLDLAAMRPHHRRVQ